MKISQKLLVILMMFPQFVETIYSPALPSIAATFGVSENKAQWTISFYFISFAIGVVFWGILSDYIGRRKAMINGLILYCIASIVALAAPNFEMVLTARVIAAFGIAVGSVITQTILRDLYVGKELNKIFSLMGAALSISPIIGLLVGGIFVQSMEYYGVFALLAILSAILTTVTSYLLPETKQRDSKISFQALTQMSKKIYSSLPIWLFALLIMGFNVLLFSYYTFAPFIFEKVNINSTLYGYSGIVLAIGTFTGSYINKYYIKRCISPYLLIVFASVLSFVSAIGVYFLQQSLYFLIPILLSVAAYGIAIPNILSQALIDYKKQIGSAGAVFGLLYYLLIGIGLLLCGELPNLGIVHLLFSAIVLVLSYIVYHKLNYLAK